MNSEVHLTLVGTLLACVFAVSMILLIAWMLRVPPQISQTVAHVRRSFDAVKSILVPTTGTFYSANGIELACRLGNGKKTSIVLTYVMEIPMVSPLNLPAPELEKKAKEILESGRELVELHGLTCKTRIQRARTAGTGIVQAAKDENSDMIVLGIKAKHRDNVGELIGKTANYLLKRSNCEVIIDKLAETPEL